MFYIGARNIYTSALSPLCRFKFKCPSTGGATFAAAGTPTTTPFYVEFGISVTEQVTWNAFTETVHITGCGFLKYVLTIPA